MSWLERMRTRLIQEKSRGQILLIYGMGAMAIMGFAGLAVDGGAIFTQRRLVQNGADAAALTAARDIVKGAFSSIDSDVTTYARGNAGSTATVSWNYVDNSGASVSQGSATGVTVLVTKTFTTFFIQALGISNFTVSSRGTARVQVLQGTSDVPFMVCADALTWASTPSTVPLLDYSADPPAILGSAVGTTYWIHGSQLGQEHGDCDWTGGSVKFKGNALQGAGIGCADLPCYYPWDQGTSSGTIDVRVAGMQGCSGTTDDFVNGCVALLPIMPKMNGTGDDCPRPIPGTNGGDNACVVTWAAFQIYKGTAANRPPGCSASGSNCHKGVLLDKVLATQGAGVDWTPGANGTLVVRLVG